MRVMVLDRNPLEGKVVDHLLSHDEENAHPGAEYVGQAYTIAQGVELARQCVPDVVFWDIDMVREDIGNTVFLRDMRKINPRVLVVIVTMLDRFDYMQSTVRDGVYRYCLKPMSTGDMRRLMGELHRKLRADTDQRESAAYKYQPLVERICTAQHEPAAVLDAFWEKAAPAGTALETTRQECMEFSTFILLHSDCQGEQKGTLMTAYHQFSRELQHCRVKQELRGCVERFLAAYRHIGGQDAWQTGAEQVEKAKRMIDLHTAEEKPVNLTDVAGAVFMSPNYLSRMFKRVEGINFVDYLRACRIEHAKLLLRSTGDTVVSIAHRCGYNEANSFRRLFRSKVGMSPAEYRRGGAVPNPAK